ncbi:protocadherin Fat 2-like [Biomphalaria glabrata]|uniref:Protocadherin Fat 2-like n=1 Tax=Biomphalaria glabrata TaxID=6526 RepID=A0A9W2ZAB5_BIOGL|nr:protocadherin Fat 2-like [Biomphalaria glabrata]
MARIRLILCLLCFFCHYTQQAVDLLPPTSIELAAINVELSESQKTQKDLFNGAPLVTCEDEDDTRAFIQTISPASPCGKKCFLLQKCGAGAPNQTEFCLIFLPSEGTLSYKQASLYQLTIGCTDDLEPVATKTMTINIINNSPPVFQNQNLPSFATIPASTAAGKSVFSVAASDSDGDPIYYSMTLSPATPYLTIGYTDGLVKTTQDLKYLCENTITANFQATDKINSPITKTVTFTIDKANTAPTITNLDTTISIDENTASGPVRTLNVLDDKIGTPLTYHMTSVSGSGLELYSFDPTTKILSTKSKPNYERLDTRSVTLYFEVTDGYCTSPQYSLTININDVNESPVLTPSDRKIIEVFEENIVTPSGVTLTDEDINDSWTYSLVSSSDSRLTVDPSSGDIITTAPIDIDKNTVSKTYTVKFVATDKKGKVSNTATATVTIYDINDNPPPYFKSKSYSFAATECTDPGTPLGKVVGDDDDSTYRNNDWLVYGGGGGKMSVMSDGTVILTQACVDGETGSGEATITDQGEYPGPLSGLDVPIALTCGPCPPPVPPATAAPATTKTAAATTKATTSSSSGTAGGSGGGGITDYLGWMIPAIIGGLIWLALMGFLIYRYCFPCRNPCAGRCVRQPKTPKPPPKAQEPKPPKPEKPKKLPPPPPPPTKVTPPPPPPPQPEPPADPYLFGFWKEQFTDQDHLKQPARAAKPQPIENMPPAEVVPRGNAVPPENLKLGNPGIGQWNLKPAAPSNGAQPTVTQAAAPQKSKCVIL